MVVVKMFTVKILSTFPRCKDIVVFVRDLLAVVFLCDRNIDVIAMKYHAKAYRTEINLVKYLII